MCTCQMYILTLCCRFHLFCQHGVWISTTFCTILQKQTSELILINTKFTNDTNQYLKQFCCPYNIFPQSLSPLHIGKSMNWWTFPKIESLRFLQNYDDYNCIFGIKLKGLSLSFILGVIQ